MIDLKDIRADPDRYRVAAQNKRLDVDVDRLIELDTRHRRLLTDHQKVAAEKNQIGKQIGQIAGRLKKADPEQAKSLQDQMRTLQSRPAELKKQEHDLEQQIAEVEPQVRELLLTVPQPADDEVPIGPDDTANELVRTWGERPQFDFEPLDHVELGNRLGMFDIERGVKLSGTRNYFLTGAGAMLHHAVLRFAMDQMIDRGFQPMVVPGIVREPAMVGTGYFPLGREQTYAMPQEDPDIFLIGTAEVPLTAYHMDEVLDEHTLPRMYVAQSPSFRREAGTYGKDTAGLYRIHQFDKVEQVIICRNDVAESKKWHAQILDNAEAMLQALELPYRVVKVCTGDLGQGQAAKYDIEVWMPSRNSWGETHSASRFYDFQARRLNLRYRGSGGGLKYCHTLNNTVVASPRILIPIIELYQNRDGSVTIPNVLRQYMGGMETVEALEASCKKS